LIWKKLHFQSDGWPNLRDGSLKVLIEHFVKKMS